MCVYNEKVHFKFLLSIIKKHQTSTELCVISCDGEVELENVITLHQSNFKAATLTCCNFCFNMWK